jgi:hypothetical protein
MHSKKKQSRLPQRTQRAKPPYFLSYSTGEEHIKLFTECLDMVFAEHFDRQSTPDVLQTDNSQHDQIISLIQGCAFGVVCLDGMRPNVLFEFGAMRGANIPVLLFKEVTAAVDIAHFFEQAGLKLPERPAIAIDRQFSDAKDRFYIEWKRFEVKGTVAVIWSNYKKKRGEISKYVDIPEPRL